VTEFYFIFKETIKLASSNFIDKVWSSPIKMPLQEKTQKANFPKNIALFKNFVTVFTCHYQL